MIKGGTFMKNRIIALLTAIVTALGSIMSFTTNAAEKNYGTEVPELLELYEKYFDADYEALYFEEATSEYSSYCAIQNLPDMGYVQFYGEADDEVDLNKLRQICGYSEKELQLRCGYNKRTGNWSLNMIFHTYDHDANYEAALKITDAIAEDYKLKSAHVDVGGKDIIRQNHTCWDRIRRTDEFGIDSPLTEELTSKQIADLNSDINEKGYKASIDEKTGGIVFVEGLTEKEKLEFAVWLKENYGLYAFTYSAAQGTEEIPSERKELYYTDVKGDVNNDGLFNTSDLVMLKRFLFGIGTLTNWKNGDLCKDDQIDVFDMIEARREFLRSEPHPFL